MASMKPAMKATKARMARVVRSTLSSKGMESAYSAGRRKWAAGKADILPISNFCGDWSGLFAEGCDLLILSFKSKIKRSSERGPSLRQLLRNGVQPLDFAFRPIADLPHKRWLGPVNRPIPDNSRLVDHRVVRRHRPRIAPMPIQGLTLTNIRRPERIEQLAGSALNQLRHHHLSLGRLDFRGDIRRPLQHLITRETCLVSALCRLCGF